METDKSQGPGEDQRRLWGDYYLPEPEERLEQWRKGSRYAHPGDPWPEIPDADALAPYVKPEALKAVHESLTERAAHAEIELSRPLLDGSDKERVRMATAAVYEAMRLADIAPHDAIRATAKLIARLQEPLS